MEKRYPALLNGWNRVYGYRSKLINKRFAETERRIHTQKKIDSYKCFGGNANGQLGNRSYYSELESDKTYKLFTEKNVRGTKDSTTINYAVNGVCHQAANRFLHPSYITMVSNYDSRPKGLTTSCYVYGEYGNIFNQYKSWRKHYFKACDKYSLVIDMSHCDQSTPEGHLWYKCEKKYSKKVTAGSYIDDIIDETEWMLSILLPSLNGNPIAEIQRTLLTEREKFLEAHGIYYIPETGEINMPEFTKETVRKIVENVNELGKQLQAELMNKIGEENFVSLHGTKEYADIADVDMAHTFLLK